MQAISRTIKERANFSLLWGTGRFAARFFIIIRYYVPKSPSDLPRPQEYEGKKRPSHYPADYRQPKVRSERLSPRPLPTLAEPYYPKAGRGRPPVGVERMLRMYFVQQWCNLSDPGVEEAVYDSIVLRQFVGIDLGREQVPDETTACNSGICWRSTTWGSRFWAQ